MDDVSVGAGAGAGGGDLEPKMESKSDDLVWRDLDEQETEDILALHGEPEKQYAQLGELLGFRYYEEDDRERIVLDYLYHSLRFGKEEGFTTKQTSTFFSIMKAVIDEARRARLDEGEWPSLEDTFAHFKRLVLEHSVTLPDGKGVIVFEREDVAKLTQYVTQSFFRHFNAYKVVFTREQDVLPMTTNVVVATPFTPPPLAEATQEDD